MREKLVVLKNDFVNSIEYLNKIKKTDLSEIDFTNILGYDLNKMQISYLKEKYPSTTSDEVIKVMINIPMFVKEMNDNISNKLKNKF